MNKLYYNITEENPIIKDDYPYGFKRTKIRYYLESVKNRGDRFISQTLNPKTNEWNKPKKSTYSNVMVITEDDKGYISYLNFSYYCDKDEFKRFLDKINITELNELQQNKIKEFNAILRTRDYVKVEVKIRKFKHKTTGEIKECLDVFEMGDYEEIKDEDTEKKQNKTKAQLNMIHEQHLREEFKK